MSSNTTTNEVVSTTATTQPQETTTTAGVSMTPIPIQHNARVTPVSKPLNPAAATDEIHRLAFTAELEMEAILKCWDPIALTSVLNILLANDFPLQILMKYQLGRLIKAINKKAQRTENKPIMDASEKIMLKWHKLLPSEGQNPTSSPTPSPSPSSSPKETELVTFKQTSPPPAAPQAQPPKPAPFRLAIQKDPPAKPKAVTNTSFFDKLKGPFSTSSTVRPSFAKQRVTNVNTTDMLNRYQQNKQTAVPSPISSPTNPALSSPLGSPTTAAHKKRPFELVSSSSTTSSSSSTTVGAPEKIPKKAKTKRVRFKPDHQLRTVREYEKDPEEWNFDQTEGVGYLGAMHVDQARNLDINEGQVLSQAHHPQQHQQTLGTGISDPRVTQSRQPLHQLGQRQSFSWYSPRTLMIPESCKMPWPKQSPEAATQKERERVTLAAVYTSLSHVPPTPTEPDEPAVPNDYPPVIPLQDVNANPMESYSQVQDQQLQGVPQQGMEQGISYDSVSSSSSLPNQPVHLLHPYQPPPQVQFTPQQQIPSASVAQYTSYVPQPQVPTTPGTMYQQSQPVTSQQPQQPQHTNEQMNILMNSGLLGAISEMVRNLTPPSAGAAPPQTIPPQQQQQPYPYPYTSMPPQPSHPQPTSSRPQFAHQYPNEINQQLNTNTPSNPTKAPLIKKQQRPLIRNQTPKQKKRKRRALRDAERFLKPCKFYNTPTGCVTGDSCPFQHINQM